MSYGLIGLKDKFEGQAMDLLSEVSREQEANERLADQMDDAKSAQKKNTVATAAGAGLMMGGPAGALIGAGVGYIASELF